MEVDRLKTSAPPYQCWNLGRYTEHIVYLLVEFMVTAAASKVVWTGTRLYCLQSSVEWHEVILERGMN